MARVHAFTWSLVHFSAQFLAVIFLALAATSASTAQAEPLSLEQYLDYETVSNPQVSPDGKYVLYSRRSVDKDNDKMQSAIWIMKSDGSQNRQIAVGGGQEWSPSGDRFAYIGKDDDGNSRIYVIWPGISETPSPVTSGDESPSGIFWSRSGDQIAFISKVKVNNTWSVKLPGKPQGAKWTDDPVAIDTINYRQDRVGITNDGYLHIFVVASGGGTSRQITKGEWYVGARRLGAISGGPALSWSADDSKIYFDRQPENNADTKPFRAQVYSVDVASGDLNALTPEGGYFYDPQASADGKFIAMLGNTNWDTDTYVLPRLWVMPAGGGEPRALLTDPPSGPENVEWDEDSDGLYYINASWGTRHIHYVDLDGDDKQITKGEFVYTMSSTVDNDDTALVVRSGPNQPGDVFSVNLRNGRAKQLTHVNADIFANTEFGEVREVRYMSTEDTEVQGWIVLPPDYDDSKKYPLILNIHGGPHAMYNVGFNFTFQEFASNGYAVLYTNPRGSTGYGEAFTKAIQGIYPGRRDVADLLAGVDAAIDQGIADQDRLFITGCSGGGVLTAWTIAQTDRFKSAVSRCPVINWMTMAASADVPLWVYRFFDKPFWEDPEPWLYNSPIGHVDKVKTPTLLMTGDKDIRTPFIEAEQFFIALKTLGVDARLIPMRGEYHGTGSIPSNYLRTQVYTREWFQKYDPAHKAEDE